MITPVTALGVVTVAALAIVAAPLIRRSNGCGNHHFDDYSFVNEIDVETEPLNPYGFNTDYQIHVFQKKEAECQHEGCDATDERWREIETFAGNTN